MSAVLPARPILTIKKKAPAQPAAAAPMLVQLKPKALSIWWPRPEAPDNLWAIEHPRGGHTFGHFPALTNKGYTFVGGPIYLLYGEHWGRHNGFGIVHILEGHWRELKLDHKDANPKTVAFVANFVSRIIACRATIHCEFAGMKGNHRPLVVKGGQGMSVLEAREDAETGEPYYSVVTAMRSASPKGLLIGNL
jgi:hypothetical protein